MPALPDAPRIPYDRPELGAAVVAYNGGGGNMVELSAAVVENLVSEDDVYSQMVDDVHSGWVAVVLPPFDLAGFIGVSLAGSTSQRTPQYSTDSTNGVDGNWTDIPDYVSPGTTANPGYRDEVTIPASVIENVVAVRFGVTSSFSGNNRYKLMHIYGYLRGDDRLELWHPTLDERLPGDHFDMGDYARGGAAVDVDFRVKNLSSTKQADSVSLEAYIDSDTSPSVLGWHSLSDGGAFGAGPLALGDLAAGAISPVLTLRREPPADAVLGYWSAKLLASADSWS